MDEALRRVPALADTGIRKFYNGPESFTPDNQFVMGEAPGPARLLRRCRVQLGRHRVGRAVPGRALAEWIVEGEPTTDLVAVDIRRFAPFHGNNRWLRDRVAEVLGLHYAVPWPNRELETARPFRCSPVHDRLAAAGASFGSKMGWERPNFFAPAGRVARARLLLGQAALARRGRRPSTAPPARRSRSSTRRRSRSTSWTGPARSRRCSGSAPTTSTSTVGQAVYTPLLNRARAPTSPTSPSPGPARDEFLLVSSSATTVRDQDWIRRNLPDGLRRPGPRRDHGVRRARGDGAALPRPAAAADRRRPGRGGVPVRHQPGRSRSATATVRATRMTYVGELGWELMVPVEFAAGVYDLLLRGGRRARRDRTPATTRSSRCGWRRATARSGASSPRTTRRSRRGWSSPPR